MPAGDAQVETAPNMAAWPVRRAIRERRRDEVICTVRQRRIGMKEDERVGGSERGPGIHRRAAVARPRDHTIGKGARQRGSAVAAAAIDHDDFSAARPQWRERLQRRDDDRRFIEHSNDNRQPPHSGNIADKAAVRQPCLNG